jgi:hypothetical protein
MARPDGSIVHLADDPRRFEVAVWFTAIRLGFEPYPAGYLAAFLIASDQPITTESIDDALLKSQTVTHSTDVEKYAEKMWDRKIPQIIARADERNMAWLTHASGLLFILLKHLAEGDEGGMRFTLELLRHQGWGETLDRIAKRIDASLRSNFPPPNDPLSPAARRLLKKCVRELIGG